MKRFLYGIIFLSLILVGCGSKNDIEEKMNSETEQISTCEKDYNVYAPTYVTDTYLDGKTVLDPQLYAYPFKRSDMYISNKDLNKKLSLQQISQVEQKAEDFVKQIYTTGYRQVMANPDEFKNTIFDFLDKDAYYTDGNESISADEYAECILDWIVTNEIITDINITTDRSLIWGDGYYYVRMKLEVQNYGKKNIPVETFCPIKQQIDVGEKKIIYCDVAIKLMDVTDFNTGRIVSIEILSNKE